MALSEYMPYGAPELLDGARARMACSTLIASLTVAMLVSGLGAILARSVSNASSDPTDELRFVFDPPPLVTPVISLTPPSTAPAKPSIDPQALAVPVPDRVAPELDRTPPSLPDASNGASGRDAPEPSGRVGPLAPPDPDPAIDDFVVVDVYPSLVKSVDPIYPDLPRDAGIEGVVRVLMLVGLDGHVVRTMVAPGGSVLMLDAAALAAAGGCVFTPALTNNHPVKVWVSRSYRFSLH
mgnify:CR=1 FL=1